VVVVASSASKFVIHWYRLRISESVFSVKCLFGSKSVRKPVTRIRNEHRRYKPPDSLVVISHGHLLQLVADVDLRRHVQADTFAESRSTKHETHQHHVVTDIA
jgi:hypothetical protein